MAIIVREWDGEEKINGIDLLNHPNPVQKARYQRIVENGGKVLIGEEDGGIVFIQTSRFGKSGFIHAGNIEDEKTVLKQHMEDAKAAREAEPEDDTYTKQLKELTKVAEEQRSQIDDLLAAIYGLVTTLKNNPR